MMRKRPAPSKIIFLSATIAAAFVISLFGCSKEEGLEKDANLRKNIAAVKTPAVPAKATAPETREKFLNINLAPNFELISKVTRYTGGVSQVTYDEKQGPMADHVKFSISAIKPNRVWKLAAIGSEIEGFNTNGEWFGSGAKSERIKYDEKDGNKIMIYEIRQLQSALGKPPYELKAVRMEFLTDSGVVNKSETITYGSFTDFDESGLILNEDFTILKTLKPGQYELAEYEYEFK